MTPSLYKKIFLGLTSFLVLPAFAGTDWSFSEVKTGSGNVCVVSARNSVLLRPEDYFLEFSKIKNSPNSPIEVTLKVEKDKKANKGFVATFDGANSSIAFSLMSNDKVPRFWAIGKNLSAFMEQLQKKDDLKLKGFGGSQEASFTIDGKGFAEVLSQLEKNCNGNATSVNKAFEAGFFAGIAANIDPLAISMQETNQLRDIYYAAYPVFIKLKETQAALARVLAKYQPFIDELARVTQRLDQIQNRDLPNAQQTLLNAQKQQSDARAEIARIDALLPSLTAQVQAAQKVYDQAYAVLAPLMPEYSRLSGDLRNAQSALSQVQSQFAAVENRLRDIDYQLRSLSSEADTLERNLVQERWDRDRALTDYRNAERQRSQYNVSAEKQRRLQSNSEYMRLRGELGQLNSQLAQVERELSQIRMERERVLQGLQQCKAQTPPQDCSRYENALANANAQVAQKDQQRSTIARRVQEVNSRMSSIENQIDQDVRREYEALVRREQETRRRYENLQDIVQRDERRLSQIRNVELPRLNQEQSQLISQRTQLNSRISQLTSDVARLSRDFDNFKATNDWDRKAAAVSSAERQLQVAQQSLAETQSAKARAQQSLMDGQKTEALMVEQIRNLNIQIADLNKRSGELQAAIQPLAAERAPLDNQISILTSDFQAKKQSFADLLK